MHCQCVGWTVWTGQTDRLTDQRLSGVWRRVGQRLEHTHGVMHCQCVGWTVWTGQTARLTDQRLSGVWRRVGQRLEHTRWRDALSMCGVDRLDWANRSADRPKAIWRMATRGTATGTYPMA